MRMAVRLDVWKSLSGAVEWTRGESYQRDRRSSFIEVPSGLCSSYLGFVCGGRVLWRAAYVAFVVANWIYEKFYILPKKSKQLNATKEPNCNQRYHICGWTAFLLLACISVIGLHICYRLAFMVLVPFLQPAAYLPFSYHTRAYLPEMLPRFFMMHRIDFNNL